MAGNDWIARCVAGLRALAPYAAIELILPGGSLLAVGLWLYRKYQVKRAAACVARSFLTR